MRLHQDVRSTKAIGRLELVACELDLETVGVLEIDRVHEASIALEKLDAPFLETSRDSRERRSRHVERQVLDASDLSRCRAPCILSGLVGEHREQTSIA